MGEYTVSLRYLLSRGYPLALDSYPIWAEEYRQILNNKIIDHFYFREIGQETPDRFNFFLRRKMNEIMPYYNKLYESELIQFDPLATEFFKQGTDYQRSKDYQNVSKNRGKRDETIGEVLSKNLDNLVDTKFGQTANEETSGDYRKQGDKSVATTSKKTEDLAQDKTSKNTDDFTEDTTVNQVVTNDLHTKQVSNGETTGTAKKVGSQDTVFSDIPQAGVETTVVTAPDGTVTRTTKGYATTTTNVDTTETTNTKENTKNETNTDQTGTVTTATTGKKTNANVTDYTENTTNDNVTDFTQQEDTEWHENGDDKHTGKYTNSEDTNVKGNTKEDSERNVATNVKTGNTHTEKSVTGEASNEVLTGKGRRGANPSELIIKYRESLINIDMMVIGELETLFMGVY